MTLSSFDGCRVRIVWAEPYWIVTGVLMGCSMSCSVASEVVSADVTVGSQDRELSPSAPSTCSICRMCCDDGFLTIWIAYAPGLMLPSSGNDDVVVIDEEGAWRNSGGARGSWPLVGTREAFSRRSTVMESRPGQFIVFVERIDFKWNGKKLEFGSVERNIYLKACCSHFT